MKRSRRAGYLPIGGDDDDDSVFNRAVKTLVVLALLSVTTWAFVRAERNGAFASFGGSGSSSSAVGGSNGNSAGTEAASISLTNELLHEWNHQEDGEWSTSETTTSTTPARDGGLYAVATNEYSSRVTHKMFPYPFLEDGVLVEPYKPTKITINGINGNTFYWSIVNVKDPSIAFHGEALECLDFTVTLTVVGEYLLTVEESFDGYRDVYRMRALKQPLWVKYVRREISTLTDDDREEFLDAFRVLWDIQTKKGKEKYGETYKSLNYLAMTYNDGAGNFICDEFEAGTAFLNNHAYLRLYLEQSLRLVNPRVSLHYMDYSKYFETSAFTSGHVKDPMDGGAWTEILSDKWFGKNDPLTGQILDSRWKDTTVPSVTSKLLSEESVPLMAYLFIYDDFKKSDQHMSNPYGLLRAPWNYNPSEYLTRFNNLNRLPTAALDVPTKFSRYTGSSCSSLKSFFELYVVGKTLTNFLEAVEEQVHDSIRYTFGGAGGDRAAAADAALKNDFQLTDEQMFYVAEAAHEFSETYLSGRFIAFSNNPLNCTATPMAVRESGTLESTAVPGEFGGPRCQCNSYYLTSEDKVDELINLYFKHLMDGDSSLLDKDFESKKGIMQLVCSRMAMDGDLVGSGAAMDPLFWVTHGAVERLYQRVMFEGVLTTDSFANSKRGAPCPEHESTTTKSWLSGLSFADPSIDATTLTNAQLAEILDPRGDKYRDLLTTVYDTSSYEWCGNDFDSWLNPSVMTKGHGSRSRS
jgi:hypothetical protein